MQIFDSHTHLNSEEFYDDVQTFVDHASELGVKKIANVGSNIKLNERALDLAARYDNMYAIVGWHPEDSKDYDADAETLLEQQLTTRKVVALGEIGLDYHWDTSPVETQKKVFERQLAIAKNLHLPVSIHTRDAFEDTYDILKQANVSEIGGVMHSFNGDPEWLKKFLDLGMHISYSGVASFKNAHEVHESVKVTPLDMMLVETDAPYLTPEPYRGKQNEPGYTCYTVEAIAKLRETTAEAIAEATWDNAHEFFHLKES
ncbi:Mg-dependent DNase [Secundilactobacillus oryzae JCM 18671]|uniref:Mg-dependent DNase n=1 Tax=Secundilactobacillus oryzae JCM 18671 TaxID=1291743 RepID=A0A081BH65_9LACO|nr:TatD family hydrolase [Secundilactobacillus oryzae]GAK47383.1 Mg-dependent DNase [Secundilactobacillus oryzae JCM 18671]